VFHQQAAKLFRHGDSLMPMSHFLGKTGINVMVRLMGLLLAAVAVEIFVGGVRGLVTGLAPS
jgi:small neutral amino acid transporter SnatA (MarC family)